MSNDPLTNSSSDNIVNVRTPLVWPVIVRINDPFLFQILIVLSFDPLTISPFDNVVNDLTCLVWPVKFFINSPYPAFKQFLSLNRAL